MSFVTSVDLSSLALVLSLIVSSAATTQAAPIHVPCAYLGRSESSLTQLFVSRGLYSTTIHSLDSAEHTGSTVVGLPTAGETTRFLTPRAGWRANNRVRDVCFSDSDRTQHACEIALCRVPYTRQHGHLFPRDSSNATTGIVVGIIAAVIVLAGAVSIYLLYRMRMRRVRRVRRRRRRTIDLTGDAPPPSSSHLTTTMATDSTLLTSSSSRLFKSKDSTPVSPTANSSYGLQSEGRFSLRALWSPPRRPESAVLPADVVLDISTQSVSAISPASPSGGSATSSQVPLVQPSPVSTPLSRSRSMDLDLPPPVPPLPPPPLAPVPAPSVASTASVSPETCVSVHTRFSSAPAGTPRSGSRATSPTPSDVHEVDVDLRSETHEGGHVASTPPTPRSETFSQSQPHSPRLPQTPSTRFSCSPSARTSSAPTPRAQAFQRDSHAPSIVQTWESHAPSEAQSSSHGSHAPLAIQRRTSHRTSRSQSPGTAAATASSHRRRASTQTLLPSYATATTSPPPIPAPLPPSATFSHAPSAFVPLADLADSLQLSVSLPPAYSPPHADSPFAGASTTFQYPPGDAVDAPPALPSMPAYDAHASYNGSTTERAHNTRNSARGRPLPRIPPTTSR